MNYADKVRALLKVTIGHIMLQRILCCFRLSGGDSMRRTVFSSISCDETDYPFMVADESVEVLHTIQDPGTFRAFRSYWVQRDGWLQSIRSES